jgi:hypothetical protein
MCCLRAQARKSAEAKKAMADADVIPKPKVVPEARMMSHLHPQPPKIPANPACAPYQSLST